MKKNIIIAAVLIFFTGFAFSQPIEPTDAKADPEASKTLIITPEEQHVVNKTAKVQLEYTPLTDEVRLFYTCHAVSYDQGEAMNTALAVLKDFQQQNGYYSYKYLTRDTVKYYKDEESGFKWAMYISYLRFYR